jgi:hypothetical protein
VHHGHGVISKGGPLEGAVVVGVGHSGVQVAVSGHRGLLVPEPLAGHLAHVGGGHVADPRGDLRAVDDPVQVGGLPSVASSHNDRIIVLQQIVEELVPGSEHLGLVDLHLPTLTYCA